MSECAFSKVVWMCQALYRNYLTVMEAEISALNLRIIVTLCNQISSLYDFH